MLARIARYHVLLWLTLPAHAQLLNDVDVRGENFLYRIKNIEFFINRFNGDDDLAPLKRTSPNDTTANTLWLRQRSELIVSLFDHTRLKKKEYDVAVLSDFLRDINNPTHQRLIHFTDSLWYAVLQIAAVHQNKPVTLECVLRMQRTPQGIFTWNIQQLQCTALRATETFKNQLAFAPNVHGTDFMAVRLSLKDPAWIMQTKSAHPFQSSLLDMLARGELTLERIKSITYHFLQCQPWVFTVKYVNRESRNSGWLIDTVLPLQKKEWDTYRDKNNLK